MFPFRTACKLCCPLKFQKLRKSLRVAPFSFFFYGYGDHRDLHSFPTRRSSDLALAAGDLRQQFDMVGPIVNPFGPTMSNRSEEHTSELQSQFHLVCRLLLEK